MRSSNMRRFLIAGLLVAIGLALIVSGVASSSPDGLEKVAGEKGFLETAQDHLFADSPGIEAGVGEPAGVGNQRLSTGLAGLIGVLVTFGLGLAVFALLRMRSRSGGGPGPGKGSEPTRAP